MQSVPIFSANCAGCNNKIKSFVDNISHIGAGIFTLQDTHFKRKGRLSSHFSEFEIFESIRKKQKGGTVIGVHKSLSPILIEEYAEEFELLVVEVVIGSKSVRVITGYGPQENWKLEEMTPFFHALEEEIEKAKSSEKAVYIQLDANCKLGPQVIQGDPHAQSDNGKILSGIIERNALCVINNSRNKCKVKITRQRITKTRKEKSIIDFVLSCDDMEDMLEEFVIDEDKDYALNSYKKTKNGTKVKESDHNSLITKVKGIWQNKLPTKRIEIYNLKDKEGLIKFKDMTSKDSFLSSVFLEEGNIETQS